MAVMGIRVSRNEVTPAINKALERGPARLERALFESGLHVESIAKQLAPVNTGRYRSGITTKRVGPLTVFVGGARVGEWLEFGTRPHWPPLKPILLYVRQKARSRGGGRGREKDIRRHAYFLRKWIAKHGTKPHPHIEPALRLSEHVIADNIRQAQWDIMTGRV